MSFAKEFTVTSLPRWTS